MKYLAAFFASALLLLLIWSLRGVLLLPVKQGKHTRISTLVNVDGRDDSLEQTLDGLLWLRENGTLTGDILIITRNADDDTLHTAVKYAENRKNVTLITDGDTGCLNLPR